MANNQNAQQNNQQGNLLSRVNNPPANSSKNNNQTNVNQLRSRFSNNNPKPKPLWTITPVGMSAVRISFTGIGDPLFRILGTPLDKSLSRIDNFVEKLNDDERLLQELIDQLDVVWDSYGFHGATLMYPVNKVLMEAFRFAVMPTDESIQVKQDSEQNSENTNNNQAPAWLQSQNESSPYETYRAIDAVFVLNMLGRVRGTTLVAGTPLALETGFLNQTYICDDPRIVELALATGAIEETW